MRYFTFTLSLYILVLSLVPCGDINDCNNPENIITVNFDHNGHKHESESCSPFCICSCCGTSILNLIEFIEYRQITQGYSQKISTFIPTFIPAVYLKIWQPPKIS